MTITKIEFGSIADPEVINNNFEYLDEKLTDTSSKIYTNNSSLESMVTSQISTLLLQVTSKIEALYPVGSVYIGTTDTCPVATLFGTWEKLSSGIVTAVNSSVPIKGTGATLGLNNSGGSAVGYLNLYRSSYNEAILSSSGGTRGNVHVTTNANKSGIVGTASSTTLSVNIWKRVA